MARNKVMTLWNAVVTAFLALCTALGLITTAASAAVPQTEKTRNSDSAPSGAGDDTFRTAAPATPLGPWSMIKALPPTMKQRIHAEAHGMSPSCRHRLPDTEDEPRSTACSDETSSSRPEPVAGRIPLQR